MSNQADVANFKQKYRPGDDAALVSFIQKGYAFFENFYDPVLITACREFFFQRFNRLDELSKKGEFDSDVNGWAVAIIDLFQKTELYDRWITNRNVLTMLKNILGPDIAVLGYDALWINVPKNKDPVLLKGQHTDAWTGTGINTIFAKTFFTDVDTHNGMSVCPGSHLQGLIPVRNRAIDPMFNINFEEVNLDNAKAGDLLVWHPLLIHSTTGHSDKNIRISITSRFTSTETPFSSQERALGYRCLSVGPMNQVNRMIGNDYLTPLRTYGGFAGVDRRIAEVYEYSEYKTKLDYKKFLT
ncbi:MAG: phytanoyl-CoA dioxygenase family protein [Bdellovibrionota bacterium]